jgi:hypothetical protein
MKYYIIQEKGYEYNDEIYSVSEYGSPVQVFKSKTEANLAADKLNYKKLLDTEIGQYAYDITDIVDDMDTFLSIINAASGKNYTEEDIDYKFEMPQLSYEEYQKIKDCIDLNFYDVVECDGE